MTSPAPSAPATPAPTLQRKRRLEAFRHRPSLRDFFLVWLPTLAIVVGAFWLTYYFVQPAPPDHLAMSTGAPDGAYHQYALKYQAILARDGVALELKPSSGSVENLARLRDDNAGVDVAFVQGGLGPLGKTGLGANANPTTNPATNPAAADTAADEQVKLHSLGNLAYEGVWIFTRGKKELTRLTDLARARVAIGPPGSGSRKVALDLFAAHGVPASNPQFSPLSGRAAIDALKRGEIDAIFLIAAPEAPVVRELAATRDLHVMSYANAQAIARRFPYLTAVTLAQGSFDLQADLPARDVQMVATKANLVARADLHPALIYLLLEAASEVHGAPGLFHNAGEFPSAVATDFPLSEEAQRYYKTGRPFLQRYLPYWLANLVQRMLVFLVPIIGVLVPVLRLLPSMVNWRRQQRINRWYGELKFLELDLDARELGRDLSREQLAKHITRLEEIDEAARYMRMPLDFSDRVYTLRQHIDFVRARLAALSAAANAADATGAADNTNDAGSPPPATENKPDASSGATPPTPPLKGAPA